MRSDSGDDRKTGGVKLRPTLLLPAPDSAASIYRLGSPAYRLYSAAPPTKRIHELLDGINCDWHPDSATAPR